MRSLTGEDRLEYLVEFKARAESLTAIRKKLRDMNSHFVGTFRQKDTFFNVPRGRLKLRRIKGKKKGTLIYYEREDIPGPKKSKASILEVPTLDSFESFFGQVLGKEVVINKRREIYVHEDMQIHLDTVENLGTFVEFEKKSTEFAKTNRVFENLAKKLEIKSEDRLEGSYSDIVSEKKQTQIV